MASHLVGGEAHVARRVQVQVLLLPPRVALGMGKPIPFAKRDAPLGLARSTRAATASFELERTANGEAIRSELGGSREG